MAQSSNSPESQPQDPRQFEAAAGQTGPEQAPVQPPEQPPGPEQRAEQQIEAADQDSQIVLPPVTDDSAGTADDMSGDTSSDGKQDDTATADASMPTVAEDVDVIEKAWVNKAKQIIEHTKDDPHAQEEEFEKLQIEYHKKRYGRDIKAAR